MRVERLATRGAARSLVWDGDDLVDVVGGWRRRTPDGTESPARLSWAYPFDQAVVSPSGRFHVLYAERGTKALLLDRGTIARELNRSFYHATDYDYPVALGRLPDGREILVHCPDRYSMLEIDDPQTGTRLTAAEHRDPPDVFHSRLAASLDGRHLLAAGWVWHPYGIAQVFDLARALADPSTLDGPGIVPLYEAVDAEVGSACWLDADRIVMATTTEEPLDGDQPDALGPGQLGVWSITTTRWLHRNTPDYRDRHDDRLRRPGHCPAWASPTARPDQRRRGRRMARRRCRHQGRQLRRHPRAHTGHRAAPHKNRLAIAQPDHIAVIHLPPT